MEYEKSQIVSIKKIMKKTKDIRMHKKLLVIQLHMRKYQNKHIASIVSLDEHTVGIYIKHYQTDSIEGLTPKKQSGRPCLLTNEQEDKLYATIKEKTPDEEGFDPFKNWTASIACLWVEREFNVKFSVGGMTDLFHRINLSNTRPTYVLAKADSEKQAQFIEDFECVKKNYITKK